MLARLVEDEQREVREQRPGDRQALALAAGHARAALAHLRARARRQLLGPVEQPRRRERRAQLRSVLAPRRASRRFSSSVLSNTCASWATSPTTRPVLIAVEVCDLHPVERHRPAARRGGTAAAPRRASTCRRRWVRRRRPAGRGRGRGRRRRAPGRGARIAKRRPLTRRACGRRGSASGCAGSLTGAGVSITSITRAAQRRTRWSVCVAAGRPVTSSNATSGISASPASSTPSSRPSCTAVTPTSSAPHIARPAAQAREALPDARGAGARAGDARERDVRRRACAAAARRRAVDEQLGRALEQVDHATRSAPRAPPPGWPRARAASRPVSHGTSVAATSSATSRIRPAAGSIHHTSATVAAPTTRAMANGGTTRSSRSCSESTSCDEPREQIAAAERRQAERGEPLERVQ